jgi:hypothetical protein
MCMICNYHSLQRESTIGNKLGPRRAKIGIVYKEAIILNLRQSQPSQKQSKVSHRKDAPNPVRINKSNVGSNSVDAHIQRSRT